MLQEVNEYLSTNNILKILYSTRVLIPTKILINLCYVRIKSYKHIIRGCEFMEKLEKMISGYKGLIIFYLIVAVLAFMLSKKIEEINSQAQNIVIRETYYA